MAYLGKRQWLLKVRKEKGFSQALTGAMAGISQPMYNYIELGYKNPSKEQAAGIAEALGITYDDFIRNEETEGRFWATL